MSGIRVAALVVTNFFVVASRILLVACRGSRKFYTGVIAAGATCPAVVVRGASRGLDTCSAELFLEVCNGDMQLCKVLQGNEELGVGGSAVYGECTVGCSENCYLGAITGSGCW